jgi:undecaprenyl-diphosphatase
MRDTRNQTLGLTLLAAGAAAAAGFIGTAHVVRGRRTQLADLKVRERVPHDATHDTPHGRAIETAQKVGKWWIHTPLTAAAAALLWRQGHRRAAGALSLASASSAIAAQLFDAAIFRRQPPPGHPDAETPSFPSGHAMQLAAVSLTAGYVLMREELAPAAIAMPLAFGVPLASSGMRLYQDRHWGSDVLGGWLAGLALATWSSAAYELVPEQRLADFSDAVGERARASTQQGARVVARGTERAARAARTTEKAVARTMERAADLVTRRKPGVMDIVRAFAEDVFLR